MSSKPSLDAATQDRKSRLAQLKSLKRKQPSDEQQESSMEIAKRTPPPEPDQSVTTTYLSGRNYDVETRGPKLGFEVSPAGDAITLEDQAEVVAEEIRTAAEAEEQDGKPLDFFKLQPKNPNWDLKRELDTKLSTLNARTSNAINRLIRERTETAKREREKEMQLQGNRSGEDEAEDVGMEGAAFVEAMNMREREDKEEAMRESAEDEGTM